MSSPPNRLSTYRSYSYYHILAICDSPTTAHTLATSSIPEQWKHTSANHHPNGRYSAKSLTPPYTTGSTDPKQYCILIDGSTNASYVIDLVKISSTTAGGATPQDLYTSIAVEGTIEVSEPKGVVFLDQIVKCCVEMGVDLSTSVFVLKTVFVGYGYKETEGDFVDTVTDIAPFMFNVINATGTFTESGGKYVLEAVSCVDGAARLPQYSKLGNTISITGQATLKQTLTKFAASIQENYNTYYDCVTSQLTSALYLADPTMTVEQAKAIVAKNLSRVTYLIDVPDEYASDHYKVNDSLEQLKTSTDCDTPIQVTIPAHTSIEDGISHIMNSSKQVKEDMAIGDKDKPNQQFGFKVRAWPNSTPVGTGNDKHFAHTVTYRIHKFEVPQSAANAHAKEDGDIYKQVKDPVYANNIIRYEYLYTGKNVDIIEFDIKVNFGLAYLQIATTSNSFRGQLEATQSRTSGASALDLSQFTRGGKVVPRPVYFGTQVTAPLAKNTHNPALTIQSMYTLTKHSSIELAEATMKIVGNPSLLGSVTATSSPVAMTTSLHPQSADASPDPLPTEATFKNWGHVPSFAKVKIKMPRNNDDISAFTGGLTASDQDQGELDYARDFWFDGYYYVYGIEHLFDNGIFTQVFHMLAMTPEDSVAELTTNPAPLRQDLTEKINQCFDSMIGCSEQPKKPSNKRTAGEKLAFTTPCPPPTVPGEANKDTTTGKTNCNNVPGYAPPVATK